MIIELKGNVFEVTFKYKPTIVDRIRQITGKRYDGSRKKWLIPVSSRVELEKMVYQIRPFENIQWVTGQQKQEEEEEVAYNIPELPELDIPHLLKVNPYPYQLKGIARGLQLKRFMNCDEPGLGKTLQSIATINLGNAFPCLVICPSALKVNWEREWHKFTDKKAMVLTDKVRDTWTFFYQTGMYQVFIVNYESLKKYFVQRIKKESGWTLRDVEFRNSIQLFKSVIIDESHRCKSSSTQQAKFCKGICNGKEWVIELTGTPVVNKPKDLIPQLSILSRMEDFGGYKTFVNRYCSGQNENCWLREVEKPAGKKGKRKPIRFCDTCRNFKSDERELNDDEMDRAVEESAKRHYSDLCALNHSLRFKMPNEYNDDNWGFYCKECKDYEEI